MSGPIRVLLADDQHLVRGALAALLSLEADIEVVAEVSNGAEVVGRAVEVRPDVAILDVQMPALDGIAATAQLRAALPSCRVLVVTTFGRPGYLRRALSAGASGFVVKDAPAERLADAIRRVRQGLRVVDPDLAAASLAEGESPLTSREQDVLVAARDGGTVADIACRLMLSEGTVRNHLSNAIGKIGARTRADAARIADERGWLQPVVKDVDWVIYSGEVLDRPAVDTLQPVGGGFPWEGAPVAPAVPDPTTPLPYMRSSISGLTNTFRLIHSPLSDQLSASAGCE